MPASTINKSFQERERGFTLIELMVSLAIMVLLSTVISLSISNARAKARDLKAMNDMVAIKTALALYKDKHGNYPNETPVTTNMWTDNFNSMASQLVADGDIDYVPVAPPNHAYNYYNYGGSVIGALVLTYLEAATPNVNGYPNTCRPWPPATNWCGLDNTTGYCLCNPY